MPRRHAPVPSYRKCCVHGNVRAVVTLTDSVTRRRRSFYLGPYGEPESRQKYLRLVSQWEANGRRLPGIEEDPIKLTDGPTITQLCHEYWMAVKGHSTSQIDHIKAGIRILTSFFGEQPAVEFGPKKLRFLREQMIVGGNGRRTWGRRYVNQVCGHLRRMYRWGVSHEMIPVAVYETLKTVEPLKRGRTNAREGDPVRPVSDEILAGTIHHLNRQLRAVVELQLLTGARPAEILKLRPADILTSEHTDVWLVRPEQHKTAYRGRDRTIYFGPHAQSILRPFLRGRPATAHMFSPAEAEVERRAAMHAARKTPLSCGNRPGTNKKESPQRSAGEFYDIIAYRRAIQYACDRAFPPPSRLGPRDGETKVAWKKRLTSKQRTELEEWQKKHRWHPYQLRHNAATALRRQFGLEAAQLILGHSSAQITDAVYADRDREKIMGIVKKSG